VVGEERRSTGPLRAKQARFSITDFAVSYFSPNFANRRPRFIADGPKTSHNPVVPFGEFLQGSERVFEAAVPSITDRRDTWAIGSAKEEETYRRMLRLAEDHSSVAQGASSRNLEADWIFTLVCAAYNLVRIRNLTAAPVPA
jgi:hypothetical protein